MLENENKIDIDETLAEHLTHLRIGVSQLSLQFIIFIID